MLAYLSEAAPPILLLALMMAYMAFGDYLTKKSRALLPSVFIMVLLMAGSVWLGLIPPDIVRRVGFTPPLPAIATALLVGNMGTSLKIKDITSNGRIVLLGMVALAGVALGCLTIGRWLFGWYNAVVATPVVGGGIVAMLEMQAAAADIGGERGELLASLAAMILAVQSLPAFLIIPPFLKRAMRQDLASQTPEELAVDQEIQASGDNAEKGTYLPDKYWSPATIVCALGLVGALAFYINRIMQGFVGHFALSISVITLLLAILLTELRILPRNAAVKAGINGFVLLVVIFNAFSAVLAIDLPQFLSLLGPVIGMIAAGILGIFVATYLFGRFVLKMNTGFAFVLGLNCLLGFPLNLVLTQEAIGSITNDDPQVERYLTARYVPPMLVAGFVTITIGSVFLAGIMRSLL